MPDYLTGHHLALLRIFVVISFIELRSPLGTQLK
jgi:hypothetical protein